MPVLSPACFNCFSKPFNSRIFARCGGGMMHNRGPNPCMNEYRWHSPRIYSVDLAYRLSKKDMPAFKEAVADQGVIYLEFTDTPEVNLQDATTKQACRPRTEADTPKVALLLDWAGYGRPRVGLRMRARHPAARRTNAPGSGAGVVGQ